MATIGDVHWHEGLFLQPHHMQRLQRNVNAGFSHIRSLVMPYSYGVVQARLSSDDLVNHRVRFDQLHVIMPGGVEVRFPQEADLPVLNIKERFQANPEPFVVYLGVPLWSENDANAVDEQTEEGWRTRRIYQIHEADANDENTGKSPVSMKIRRVNARLLLDPEAADNLDVIPVLRVEHGVGEFAGIPRPDTSFIPPCFVMKGSPVLYEMVRGIANLVEAARQELVSQILAVREDSEVLRSTAVEQQAHLGVLSRYGARLPQLVNAGRVSPFDIYLEVSALAAELCAMSKDSRNLENPDYNHDNPAVCFQEVEMRIRSLLRSSGKRHYLKIAFEHHDNEHVAELADEHFEKTNQFYLAIRTSMDPNELVRLVQKGDRFKLMPPSLAKRAAAIFGVKLVVEHAPPPVFPLQTGLHYFRIESSDKDQLWQAIEREKGMTVVGLANEIAQFEISLYMTVPAEMEA